MTRVFFHAAMVGILLARLAMRGLEWLMRRWSDYVQRLSDDHMLVLIDVMERYRRFLPTPAPSIADDNPAVTPQELVEILKENGCSDVTVTPDVAADLIASPRRRGPIH